MVVLGSSIDYKLAGDFGGVLITVSYPVFDVVLNKGFAGFRGGNTLFETILNTQLKKEVKRIV